MEKVGIFSPYGLFSVFSCIISRRIQSRAFFARRRVYLKCCTYIPQKRFFFETRQRTMIGIYTWDNTGDGSWECLFIFYCHKTRKKARLKLRWKKLDDTHLSLKFFSHKGIIHFLVKYEVRKKNVIKRHIFLWRRFNVYIFLRGFITNF